MRVFEQWGSLCNCALRVIVQWGSVYRGSLCTMRVFTFTMGVNKQWGSLPKWPSLYTMRVFEQWGSLYNEGNCALRVTVQWGSMYRGSLCTVRVFTYTQSSCSHSALDADCSTAVSLLAGVSLYVTVLIISPPSLSRSLFLVRYSIRVCYSALYAIGRRSFRPSVCLSHGWISQNG